MPEVREGDESVLFSLPTHTPPRTAACHSYCDAHTHTHAHHIHLEHTAVLNLRQCEGHTTQHSLMRQPSSPLPLPHPCPFPPHTQAQPCTQGWSINPGAQASQQGSPADCVRVPSQVLRGRQLESQWQRQHGG